MKPFWNVYHVNILDYILLFAFKFIWMSVDTELEVTCTIEYADFPAPVRLHILSFMLQG